MHLPTSNEGIRAHSAEQFTNRMLAAINHLTIDMMTAIAGKQFQHRRRRK